MGRDLKFVFEFGWPYIRRYRTRFFLGVFLGMLFGASQAIFPWAVKTFAERVVPGLAAPAPSSTALATPGLGAWKAQLQSWQARVNQTLDVWLPAANQPLTPRRIAGCLLFIPLLVFLRGALGYTGGYCLRWASERIMNDMRFDVLAKLQSLSLDFFHRSKTGDLMMRMTADTLTIYQALISAFANLVREPIAVVGILIALWLIDWQLTLFSMAFFPLCVVPIIILGKKTRKAGKGSIIAETSQSSLLVEALSNIRVVKAFGLEERQQERFRDLARERMRHNMRAGRADEMVNPLIEVGAAFGISALLLFVVATNRSIPDLLGFAAGIGLFYAPVKRIAKIHLVFQRAFFAVERIRGTFAEQPTVAERAEPLALPEFSRALEFDQVQFSYGDEPVLDRLSFRVERGQHLGIAGPSGSGKSTIVNLIFRFYDPASGAVRLDGVDIRDVPLARLREQMALVSQEVLLFDATVAENIGYGRRGASREEIEQSGRLAGADIFIRQLPQGYDTMIGERGVRLSGGQKQRLAIARALVRRAPILVLDEATAALDSASEAEVQESIDRLGAGHTLVTVAHRLGTLRHCDRILVVDAGRIVEQGTFAGLLAQRGLFASMAARQGITSPLQDPAPAAAGPAPDPQRC